MGPAATRHGREWPHLVLRLLQDRLSLIAGTKLLKTNYTGALADPHEAGLCKIDYLQGEY